MKNSFAMLTGVLTASVGSDLLFRTVKLEAAQYKDMKAEAFDLTKQATVAEYPVMFDRPTGVNASALANAVVNLGTGSELYKDAVKSVPELANTSFINGLLNNAMNGDAKSREIIVKLINWYNGLGGQKLMTQKGATYTVSNLDEPINTIAVAFTNGGVAKNKVASDYIQARFGAVKTTGDVMKAMDAFGAGLSDSYSKAFAAYDVKLKAPGANLAKLAEFNEIKPVLDGYEAMYSNGASIIRKNVLDTSGVTEASVAFFESAVLTGAPDTNGDTSRNEVKRTTKWVDETGKDLTKPEEGPDFKESKNFPGYKLITSETNGETKTFKYEKVKEEPKKETVTKWLTPDGKPIKPEQKGDQPAGDIPGYKFKKTEKDPDGNTVHIFEKNVVKTHWLDEAGKELKSSVDGEKPDKEGDDVPGYTLIGTKVLTPEDAESLKTLNRGYKEGDVLNVYRKKAENKVVTRWVNEKTGEDIKPAQEGSHPDREGDDLPGYRLVTIKTDSNGNVINNYNKIVKTNWVDKDGNPIKPAEVGEKPHGELPGYKFVETKKDPDGNVIHIFEKDITTKWVDDKGNPIKEEKGDHPHGDLPGYKYIRTEKDPDGNPVHVFKKVVVTNWVNEANGDKLKPTEEGSHPDLEGDDLPGYTLSSVKVDDKDNVTNNYKKEITTTWVDENGNPIKKEKGDHPHGDLPGYTFVRTDKDKDGNPVHVFKKNVKTNWVDKDGKPIKPAEEGELPHGDLPGYTFLETKKDKDGNIVHVFEKDITTTWVDENGNPLKSEKGDHPHGDLPGYIFVETKKDKDGNPVHVFKKDITTKWVDENGNPLKEEKGEHPHGEIPGYDFVETTKDKDGNPVHKFKKSTVTRWVDENGNPIKEEKGEHPHGDLDGYTYIGSEKDKDGNTIHKFHKVKTVTRWVNEEGKDLQPAKEGSHPDKEGDDLPGYKFKETKEVTVENGDREVRNTYTVDAATVVTHYVDENGKLIKDDVVGKEFGKKLDIPGYELIEERLSKDGKEKMFVYRKAKAAPAPTTSGKQLPQTGDSSLPLGLGVLTVGMAGLLARRRKDEK
jgi:cshA protein